MLYNNRADVQLSPNFWLSEFEHSEIATRNGLRNEAGPVEIANLKRLAYQGQDVRALLGNVPITLSSGLRTLIVNGLVTKIITPDQVPKLGSRPDLMTALRNSTSAHKDGRAMDFTAATFGSPREIVARLRDSALPFDQLIFEGTWVHYGIAKVGDTPRRQVLTAVFKAGEKTRYLPGLV